MRERIIQNLSTRFGFYADLIDQVDDDAIGATTEVPRSRPLHAHLWCVVGSRESYASALAAGEWQGWGSSLKQFDQAAIREKLASSADQLRDAIDGVSDWTDERERLLAEIAEHEVMHEGQIIRLMFALKKELPESSAWAVCG